MNSILSRAVYRHMFIKRGNWLRILCRVVGHAMVQSCEEVPRYHAHCVICGYEIIAE